MSSVVVVVVAYRSRGCLRCAEDKCCRCRVLVFYVLKFDVFKFDVFLFDHWCGVRIFFGFL